MPRAEFMVGTGNEAMGCVGKGIPGGMPWDSCRGDEQRLQGVELQ